MTEMRRKVIGVPLQKSITKTEQGFLIVRGYFTSDNKDEVGDIITRAATERAIPKYRQWGNIRYMHMPEPVGKVLRIGVEDGLEWNEVEILVVDPKAILYVENGLLKALSVGILIDPKNLDILKEGGWVINDYQLAEISLVDHPANYDAMLQLSLDEPTRTLIREQGLIPALRSLGISTNGVKMENEKEKDLDLSNLAQTEEPAAETPAEVPAEAPAAEEAAKDMPMDDCPDDKRDEDGNCMDDPDKALAATPAVEQPVAEETPAAAPVADPAITEIHNALGVIAEAMKTMSAAFAAMTTSQKALQPEAQVAPERPEGVAEPTVDMKALQDENAALKARIAELELPADGERKGLIPTEEVPAAEPEQPAETVANSKAIGLRDAVKQFVNNRH